MFSHCCFFTFYCSLALEFVGPPLPQEPHVDTKEPDRGEPPENKQKQKPKPKKKLALQPYGNALFEFACSSSSRLISFLQSCGWEFDDFLGGYFWGNY